MATICLTIGIETRRNTIRNCGCRKLSMKTTLMHFIKKNWLLVNLLMIVDVGRDLIFCSTGLWMLLFCPGHIKFRPCWHLIVNLLYQINVKCKQICYIHPSNIVILPLLKKKTDNQFILFVFQWQFSFY